LRLAGAWAKALVKRPMVVARKNACSIFMGIAPWGEIGVIECMLMVNDNNFRGFVLSLAVPKRIFGSFQRHFIYYAIREPVTFKTGAIFGGIGPLIIDSAKRVGRKE
jgi:hypothetical protein